MSSENQLKLVAKKETHTSIRWFQELFDSRLKTATLLSIFTTSLIFFATIVYTQSAVFHPLQSLQNILRLIAAPRFWILTAALAIYIYAIAYATANYCFSALYEPNYNVSKPAVLTAAGLVFTTCIVFRAFTAAAAVQSIYSSWTTSTLFVCVAWFAAWQTALSINFRWQSTRIEVLTHLYQLAPIIATESALDVGRNAIRGFLVAAPLCALHSTTRSTCIDLLIAPRANVVGVLIVYSALCACRLIFELVNASIMQPLTLPLTNHHAVSIDDQRQQKSLIVALASDDDLLRIFGFRALNSAINATAHNRAAIYALSQPGQQPRTWLAIYEVSMRVVEEVRQQLHLATSFVEPSVATTDDPTIGGRSLARHGLNARPANTPTIRPAARRRFHDTTQIAPSSPATSNGSHTSIDGSPNYRAASSTPIARASKSYLLKPPSLNPRHTVASKPRPTTTLINVHALPGSIYLQRALDVLRSTFFKPAPVINAYYLELAEHAIVALAALACHSVTEDRYGVVQNAIADIVGNFLKLELSIDVYVRASSNNKLEQTTRPNLEQLEAELITALRDLYAAFQPHIDALNLTDTERQILSIITTPSADNRSQC